MKYLFEKRKTIEIFYYFLAIDGEVTGDEKSKFDEIAMEIDPEAYAEYKDELLSLCNEYIENAKKDNDFYDLIQEKVDRILDESDAEITEGISRRLMLWDLYVLSMGDNIIEESEKRFIGHVARTLGVEKSVILEMEQLIQTAMLISKQLNDLNSSNRNYSEIRPLVDETEKRKLVVLDAAKSLIEDDYFEVTVKKKKMLETIGEKTKEGFNKTKEVVGKTATKGLKGLTKGLAKGVNFVVDKFDK